MSETPASDAESENGDAELDTPTLVSGLIGTAASINQILFFILIFSFIGIALFFMPDAYWLNSAASVEIPLLGGSPINVLIFVVPVAIVGGQAYYQMQLNHLMRIHRQLEHRLSIPPVLHPAQHAAFGTGAGFIVYLLGPAITGLLAYKAMPFQDPFNLPLVLFNVEVTAFGFAAVCFLLSVVISFLGFSSQRKAASASLITLLFIGFVCLAAVVYFVVLRPNNIYDDSIIFPKTSADGASIPDFEFYKASGANFCEALESKWWRRIDLSYADLSEANLEEAKLPCANLTLAKLDGADLRKANLYGARLIEAKLNGAKLGSAKLYFAYLDGAALRGAELIQGQMQYASLQSVDLRRLRVIQTNDLIAPNLQNADLDCATIFQAKIYAADVDLIFKDAKNLLPNPEIKNLLSALIQQDNSGQFVEVSYARSNKCEG